jgi:uncharacterized protein (TIGR03382 family)
MLCVNNRNLSLCSMLVLLAAAGTSGAVDLSRSTQVEVDSPEGSAGATLVFTNKTGVKMYDLKISTPKGQPITNVKIKDAGGNDMGWNPGGTGSNNAHANTPRNPVAAGADFSASVTSKFPKGKTKVVVTPTDEDHHEITASLASAGFRNEVFNFYNGYGTMEPAPSGIAVGTNNVGADILGAVLSCDAPGISIIDAGSALGGKFDIITCTFWFDSPVRVGDDFSYHFGLSGLRDFSADDPDPYTNVNASYIVPTPGTCALLVAAGLAALRRRRNA